MSKQKESIDIAKPVNERPVDEMLADEIMCSCSGTTRGKVYDLVMQGKDFEAISRWTGVNTGCSGCEWDIQVFVNALIEAKNTQ